MSREFIELEINYLCSFIYHEHIRENLLNYFNNEVENWFWVAPAAKKYHPHDERGEGGLLLHTKRAMLCGTWLIEANRIEPLESDYIMAAIAVHDTMKIEIKDERIIERQDHPDRLKETSLLPEIVNLAKMHMGPFYRPERWTRVCELGRLVYYADFISSQTEFLIPV